MAEHKAPACDCVDVVEARLKERNTRLAMTILFGGGGMGAVPTILTEQIERGRGKPKAVSMIPSFCPFCGVKYPTKSGAV